MPQTPLLGRDRMQDLIFGRESSRRYTQDSPILPDVWMAFGEDPIRAHDLLLTPHWDGSAGALAARLRKRLATERKLRRSGENPPSAEIAHIHGNVAAKLHFSELIRVVLPMTEWWRDRIGRATEAALRRGGRAIQSQLKRELQARRDGASATELKAPDLPWLVDLVGSISWCSRHRKRTSGGGGPPDVDSTVTACLRLFKGMPEEADDPSLPENRHSATVWTVNLNREAKLAIERSVLAVKADAARRLFEVSCRELAWAVIDSGIDARHPAFIDWHREREREQISAGSARASPRGNGGAEGLQGAPRSRIVYSYDFTKARGLLDPDNLDPDKPEGLPESLQQRLKKGDRLAQLLKQDMRLARDQLTAGREVDWSLFARLLEVPCDQPPPTNDHGTHVAGILAADWREGNHLEGNRRLEGICPDIRIYDLRVLDEAGKGNEFEVIAALQFVRQFNAQRDHPAIHGVNLSLSIAHDVVNYACGRTPVCEECERLVASGVVVVAAAGNEGYSSGTGLNGDRERYRTVSITDPGNAEGVITVGATHRFQPHTYGVSYFSSRGPTGDGRRKPDLVAPGEKITAPVPGERYSSKDGTSMAAPHVSGAAALLMARHMELVGQPARIKEILCATATDLGRESYFQGCGMLDALRALQSV